MTSLEREMERERDFKVKMAETLELAEIISVVPDAARAEIINMLKGIACFYRYTGRVPA